MPERLESRLFERLAGDGREPEERRRLARLMRILAELPAPPDPLGLVPRYAELRDSFLEHLGQGDGEELEESFLELYAHLHGHEAPYTRGERARVNETGGYWCHAGGLSPILKAAPHLNPDTTSGDFGAGNGLQTLLMQRLWPHRRTIQIEISSRMVEAGRRLQEWLGISEERVTWIVGDVLDHGPEGMDFIYMYRPVKPVGEGRLFYERFARSLASTGRSVVVFSIADCLREFLPLTFEVFYGDGHLTCWRRKAP